MQEQGASQKGRLHQTSARVLMIHEAHMELLIHPAALAALSFIVVILLRLWRAFRL